MAQGYEEVINYLHGGFNNALDPADIGDNQLQEGTGLEYRPPRIGLFGTQGRSSFGTWGNGGGNMYGLVFAQFDTSATSVSGKRLVGFAGSSAIGASADAQTGTFATLKSDLTSGASAFADGVHYGNDWFFWNGTDASWRLDGMSMVASARHGLTSAWGLFSVAPTASAGTVNDIGIFNVWMTEYLADSAAASGLYLATEIPTLESIATPGTVASYTVTLSATGLMINVTAPLFIINGANMAWRTYVSVAGGKFPFGWVAATGTSSSPDHVASSLGAGGVFNFTPIASTFTAFPPYPVVQPPGGVAVSSNGPPAKPYDMAVFQDSLVLIDKDDRQKIKYSLPDYPDYFPSTYFIPFETEEQDQLTALEVCNNALLVFSSWYGFRVDDLPRATDGDEIFAGRSRAKEPFSHHHGCIAPLGTAVFDIYGSGQLCAFVCRDGLHITDGFKTDYLSNDLDWEATVNISLLARCRLLNNPKRHRIEFYYPDAASVSDAYIWKRLDFYYHPGMIMVPKMGFPRLPMLGPTDVPGPAATLGVFNGDWRVYCGSDFSPTAWFEGTGTVDGAHLVDASGSINKRWRTKDWYHAGDGGEFEIERVYLSQAVASASGSYTVTGYFRTDDLGTYTATGTVDQSQSGAIPVLSMGNRAQSVSLRGAKDDGGAWQEINYVTFVVKDRQRLMSAKSAV